MVSATEKIMASGNKRRKSARKGHCSFKVLVSTGSRRSGHSKNTGEKGTSCASEERAFQAEGAGGERP